MHPFHLLAIFATIWFICPLQAIEQQEDIDALFAEVKSLYDQGRYEEGIPLAERVLATKENTLGPNHPKVSLIHNILGLLYFEQGLVIKAEEFFKNALKIVIATQGDKAPNTAVILMNLGNLYKNQKRYDEAEPTFKVALGIREEKFGEDHLETAHSLRALALLYLHWGRYDDAQPLYKRALAIHEQILGPDHPEIGKLLQHLSAVYVEKGRYGKAEPLTKRALAIFQQIFGPNSQEVATSLHDLGILYHYQGEYYKAETLLKQALEITENDLQSNNISLLPRVLQGLAVLYWTTGRYDEAEPLYKRSLLIFEATLGSDHEHVARTLSNLGRLYITLGRFTEAKTVFGRSLEITERNYGINHPNFAHTLGTLGLMLVEQGHQAEAERHLMTALDILGPSNFHSVTILNDLGLLYFKQERYESARSLFQRSLEINEEHLGSNHHYVATNLNNLAMVSHRQGYHDEAELYYKRSLDIFEESLGPGHAEVGNALNNLALFYTLTGRYEQAEPLYKRSMVINIATLGETHYRTAGTLHNLAMLMHAQNRYSKAESLYRRAIAIFEKSLGPNDPDSAYPIGGLAQLFYDTDRETDALNEIRRSTNILQSSTWNDERDLNTWIEPNYNAHVKIGFSVAQNDSTDASKLLGETFEVSQMFHPTSTAAAIFKMTVRLETKDVQLAKMIRTHQDTIAHLHAVKKNFISETAKNEDNQNSVLLDTLRNQMGSIDESLSRLNTQLTERFPDYIELTKPRPMTVKQTQSYLHPNEALVSFMVLEDAIYLWLVGKGFFETSKIELESRNLEKAVRKLRSAFEISPKNLDDIKAFDLGNAHQLYVQLFEPLEPYLQGIDHLFLVPGGALESIPLGILVTEMPPEIPSPFNCRKHCPLYKNVSWLAQKYALTTLPAISSLRALRSFSRPKAQLVAFAGFGDPVLEGSLSSGQSATKGIPSASSLFTRGAIADVESVRALPPLGKTAEELEQIADSLGADANSLYLREKATEDTVKSLDLSGTEVIAFATHGLVSGDLTGVAEPGLVLTPPEMGTERDDGILTASEVAGLTLYPGLVILSACNTAATDGTPGAEGLSGLAKAFFYAGSKTLLVSHWSALVEASKRLTTGMFDALENDDSLGPSKALKHSISRLINDEDAFWMAHPMFWAPFVVVGEGASAVQ